MTEETVLTKVSFAKLKTANAIVRLIETIDFEETHLENMLNGIADAHQDYVLQWIKANVIITGIPEDVTPELEWS